MPEIHTLREHIAWAYANLACAHSAIHAGSKSYSRFNFMIRSRLFKGLCTGSMNMRSIFDDEKINYRHSDSCCYCGAHGELQLDHLLPLSRGGPDTADNLVRACRRCNASKGGRDLLLWFESKGKQVPLLLLRRYMKLVFQGCEIRGLLDLPLDEAMQLPLLFELGALPTNAPSLENLALWVESSVDIN